MPKRNRHTTKSPIYSSPVDFAELPTPLVSPPPLPPPEIPPLVEFSPAPEPEVLGHDLVTTTDSDAGLVDDLPRTGPAVEDDSSYRPLSPLLLQEADLSGGVLSFDPPELAGTVPSVAASPQAGHTRSPVLAREPTMLENFSRAVRNYVPSSIPIPTATPSPPRVSRPVSFGSFMTTATGPMRLPTGNAGGAEMHEYGYGYGARGGGSRKQGRGPDFDYSANRTGQEREHDHGRVPWARDQYRDANWAEDEEEAWRQSRGGPHTPTVTRPNHPSYDGDDIIWARWDVLGHDAGVLQQRRLLLLGYASGLQIWDCTDLAMVSEILNLSGLDWGCVSCAAFLPRPRLRDPSEDVLAADRPLLSIITTIREESTFLVYSLSRHRVVKRLPLLTPAIFSANKQFIVISAINPPTLHILSATTFTTLFTIPSTSLVSTPSPASITVTPSESEHDHNLYGLRKVEPPGQPIYAIAGRLLAFASPPRRASAIPSSRQSQTQTQTHDRSSSVGFGIHMTQADLSNVALKVGGTVLSGMKSLGEKAYSAALSHAGLAMESMSGQSAVKGLLGSRGEDGGLARMAGVGRFFSRSAPAAANDHHERRYSTSSATNLDPGHGQDHGAAQTEIGSDDGARSVSDEITSDVVQPTPPSTNSTTQAGHHVTVLDLEGLLRGRGAGKATPRKVAEFVTKNRAISGIAFSDDGNSILVSPKDGQVCQVFQLRPSPVVPTTQEREVRAAVDIDPSTKRDAPWHMYDLRRGRTNAVIEGVDWAEDGRWIAIGTRKRTIHVFAVNPYGGRPDQRSHIEGRVRNYTQLQPLSTEVHPIVRLRASSTPAPQKHRGPMAFTFIKSTESTLPVTLLPPATKSPSGTLASSSLPKSESGISEPTSPHRHRSTNFQDMLVFDPIDGILSLWRIFVELRSRDQGISVPTSVSLGATSVSLPGMGGAGRLAASPPKPGMGPGRASPSVGHNKQGSLELVGKESIVATWSLQRQPDWKEIRRVLEEPVSGVHAGRTATPQTEVLAHAELSTCSTSSSVLPRSLYLSHQFSFHTLGEDYHALIRRYQLDICGSEIEVRKKVQVSAYGAGGGESFLEGGFSATPRDVGRPGSSFDEPLASALSGGLDAPVAKAVLPMLPNGMPGSNPISFRNSIPIRKMAGLGDGMSEGIGRIRREIIHKARSPPPLLSMPAHLRPSRMGTGAGGGVSVPLEFDEEDEDFFGGDDVPRERVDGASSRTISEGPRGGDGTTTDSLPRGEDYESDDLWQGWDPEDKQAIEDAEMFDDISVVGFLDEEHATMVQAEKRRGRRRGQ